MRKAVFWCAIGAGLVSAATSVGATAEDFKICKSTYALCTTAKCEAAKPGSDTVECKCEVRTGFSVGSSPCEAVKQTSAGKQVRSRYFPIKSYAHCANNRPWANCYDKECIVDKDDPTKATCTCAMVENKGAYVMVTDSYTAETCTIGLWSSATITQLDEITTFIKTHGDLLPHFPLQVLNADTDTFGSMTPSSAR